MLILRCGQNLDYILGTCILCCFPSQKLLRRPPLVQSSTFLTWLRLSYPSFREMLAQNILALKEQMLQFDVDLIHSIEKGSTKNVNPLTLTL